MTENQEKEMFLILGKLVNGMTVVQSDVKDIKATQAEHTVTLAEHTATLAEHTATLAEHSATLAEHSIKLDQHSAKLDEHSVKHDKHSLKLDRLDSKFESIAIQIMENDKRHTARIEAVERSVEALGREIH